MKSPLIQSLINRIQDRFSQAKSTARNTEAVVRPLPEETRTQIVQRLDQLPLPKPCLEAVRQTCSDAIARWQTSLEAANSLVILTEPVVPLNDILLQSLAELESDTLHIHHPLKTYQRPYDPLQISASLSEALDGVVPAEQGAADTPATLEQRQHVVVISALEQCFLRCIQGWESIEHLQKQVVHRQSCFWIIGCSSWAWAFLERVCRTSTYLEQVSPLPKLTDEELRDWLASLVKEAIFLNDSRDISAAKAGDRQSYWSALANLSEGRSTIAAQLWLHSLGIQAADLPDDESASLAPEDLSLCLRKPVLPSLPKLDQTDRYLLQSLLIHGSLTQAHLTLSLGEAETQVRSRLQILRREGVVRHDRDRITLNPGHLPRLRNELSNNNFLVGEEVS
ncbi:hypothetical protein [Vacuolonema iberomarrocanum]|uniref:hypothetical protein n=1 Tax=Vacuolonema iberomarrocanum TaxID=3454632 RepID=UPI0019E5302C|nr:MarR family transcriptional regulator [filamentous cyanobacterium LEGE 07170]